MAGPLLRSDRGLAPPDGKAAQGTHPERRSCGLYYRYCIKSVRLLDNRKYRGRRLRADVTRSGTSALPPVGIPVGAVAGTTGGTTRTGRLATAPILLPVADLHAGRAVGLSHAGNLSLHPYQVRSGLIVRTCVTSHKIRRALIQDSDPGPLRTRINRAAARGAAVPDAVLLAGCPRHTGVTGMAYAHRGESGQRAALAGAAAERRG